MRLTENSGDRTLSPTTVSQKMPMICDFFTYTTFGDVCVKINTVWENRLVYLDFQRRGLFTSTYKYPSRYKKWMRGFVNPQPELTTSRPVGAKRDHPGIVTAVVGESSLQHKFQSAKYTRQHQQSTTYKPAPTGFKFFYQHKQLTLRN